MAGEEIDIPFTKPVQIIERNLDEVRVKLANMITCDLQDVTYVFDKDNGYYFYGPGGVPIADLLLEGNRYRGVLPYGGVIQELKMELHDERVREQQESQRREAERRAMIQERQRKERRRKKTKLALQKYAKVGVALTAAGVIALASLGVINGVNAFSKNDIPIVTEQSINTVANANDVLLYHWANYALSEIYNVTVDASDNGFAAQGEIIRNDFFLPIMSSYYSYLDNKESGLPIELVGDSVQTSHNSFRNAAYLFDEELENGFFSAYSFDNTPYADAIVCDENGEVLKSSSDGLFGEVYTSYGELVSVDSDVNYDIYIKAIDVPNNNYDLTNLPEDTIFINGVPYVVIEHLDDFEIDESYGMSK